MTTKRRKADEDEDDDPVPAARWRASSKTVPVHCPQCKSKKNLRNGVAAENAIRTDTPFQFRAVCPRCGTPLVKGHKK